MMELKTTVTMIMMIVYDEDENDDDLYVATIPPSAGQWWSCGCFLYGSDIVNDKGYEEAERNDDEGWKGQEDEKLRVNNIWGWW